MTTETAIDSTFQSIKTYIDARVQVDTTKPPIINASGLTIGARIKAMRELRALSQTALAGLVGVTAAAISKIESGNKNPSFDVFIKICQSLQASADFLLFGK